jgi:hypothetical protein
MNKFNVYSDQIVEISAWCIDNFGPSYTMPHWWKVEKKTDFPLSFIVEIFNDEDATLYALRWS